jgi:Ca2+-binding RTX toxin-like protein
LWQSLTGAINPRSNGGGGDDELFGMLGNDTLAGGAGHDYVFGDLAHVIRATDGGGNPRVNQKTATWHRDIILEELVRITGHEVICRQHNASDLTGARLTRFSDAHYAVLFGKVDAAGTKLSDRGGVYQTSNLTIQTMTAAQIDANIWDTRMLYMDIVDTNDDVLDGGDGNDFLIGQVWRRVRPQSPWIASVSLSPAADMTCVAPRL